MHSGIENGTQTHGSSSKTTEHRQKPGKEPTDDNLSTSEALHRSVNQQIKLATELIGRRIEELCALLANRNELKTLETANLPILDGVTLPLALRTTGKKMTTPFFSIKRLICALTQKNYPRGSIQQSS